MSDVGMTFKLFGKDVTAGKSLKDVSHEAEKTGKSLGHHIGVGSIAAGAALGGLVAGGISAAIGGLGDLVTQARDAESANRVTAQVIKSTGGAAHVTASQVDDLATAISNKTGVDDDAIKSSENLLLTFTDVRNEVGKGNDIFNQATQMVTDMSVALGQDGKSSAIQLGKALNDPIKGITALQRVGVSFTDQQRKQIKTLVEHGDKLAAQKVILKELGREFGGAAAASSDPMKKLSTMVGNLAKGLAQQLLPYIEKAAAWLSANLMPIMQKLIPVVASFAGWISKNANVLGPLVGIIIGVVGAIRVWMLVQAALNAIMALNPIGLVVIAIAALVAGLVIAYQKFGWFHALVDTVWNGIRAVVGAVVQWFTTTAWPKIRVFLSVLAAGFRLWWSIVSSVVGWILGRVGALVSWFTSTAWPKIHAVITLLVAGFQFWWQKARDVIGWIIGRGESLVSWFGGLKDKITGAVSGIWDGLTNGFKAALNWIIDRWNSMPSFTIGGGSFLGHDLPSMTFALPQLQHLATGTPYVMSGGYFNVGERGPEQVFLPQGSAVVPTGGRMSGGDTFYVTFDRATVFGGNRAQVGRELVAAMDEARRGGRGGRP